MFHRMNHDSDARFLRISVIACFILFAACVRIGPHPWNFTPVGAMALFGGAKLRNPWAAFLFPLAALFFGRLDRRVSSLQRILPGYSPYLSELLP
jgi:hypothetical protein